MLGYETDHPESDWMVDDVALSENEAQRKYVHTGGKFQMPARGREQ
jgi:hypothetical protein